MSNCVKPEVLKEVEKRMTKILDELPGLMHYVNGNVTTIALNPETGETKLLTISQKSLSREEAQKLSTEFEENVTDGVCIIKNEEFDDQLRSH